MDERNVRYYQRLFERIKSLFTSLDRAKTSEIANIYASITKVEKEHKVAYSNE